MGHICLFAGKHHPCMEKHLTVYPISSGNVLNVFAGGKLHSLRILDMHGNEAMVSGSIHSADIQVDISTLDNATYIVEVVYEDKKTARSVFVKL